MSESIHIEPFYFHPSKLEGAFVIDPIIKADERGWFFRSFAQEAFAKAGLNTQWLQMNHSFTQTTGSVRGLHFQHPPFSEVKTVSCIAGAVYDVIIDLRQGSPTYLNWFGIQLSAANKKTIYIPQGFAHGFQTLTADCELIYMHSAAYRPGAEGGIAYNDTLVNICWPLPISVISNRDAAHPLLTTAFTGIKI